MKFVLSYSDNVQPLYRRSPAGDDPVRISFRRSSVDVTHSQQTSAMPNAGIDASRQPPTASSCNEVASERGHGPSRTSDVPAPPKRRQKRGKGSPALSPKLKHLSRSQRVQGGEHQQSSASRSAVMGHQQNSWHGAGSSSVVDVTRNDSAPSPRTSPPTDGSNSGSDHLPDILNAHMPPPYSTLPQNTERSCRIGPLAPPLPPPVPPCGTLGKFLSHL